MILTIIIILLLIGKVLNALDEKTEGNEYE